MIDLASVSEAVDKSPEIFICKERVKNVVIFSVREPDATDRQRLRQIGRRFYYMTK